jgi:hypothetical protein
MEILPQRMQLGIKFPKAINPKVWLTTHQPAQDLSPGSSFLNFKETLSSDLAASTQSFSWD